MFPLHISHVNTTPAAARCSTSLSNLMSLCSCSSPSKNYKDVRRKELALESLFWLSSFKWRDRTNMRPLQKAAWHLRIFPALNDFSWYMHSSLQSKHSILIRLVTVDHVAIENTLMFALKHVWQLCQNTSCLRHPIISLTTAVQMCLGDIEGSFATFIFFAIFWGPLRKLERSPAELVWTRCFTLTTNVVQM